MKKTIYGIVTAAVLIFGLTGCTEDIKDEIDKYNETDEVATTGAASPMATSSATIMYRDGEIMGVTKHEAPINGGFQIYHIGTGEVVGFIQADGSVNNKGGAELGVCAGAVVSDDGVTGDCHVPTEDPERTITVAPPAGTTTEDPARTTTATCSFPTPSGNTSGDCPDTRNGDFNPSYSPSVCNANGYFWCSLSQSCLDKPINVNECGEMSTR